MSSPYQEIDNSYSPSPPSPPSSASYQPEASSSNSKKRERRESGTTNPSSFNPKKRRKEGNTETNNRPQKKASLGKKRLGKGRKRSVDTATPMPNPDEAPKVNRGSQSARSLESREKRKDSLSENRYLKLVQNITTIKVPFALEDIEEPTESMYDNLANKSPQCFSAKFVDKNNKTILFYFGLRHPEAKERYRELDLCDQYKRRTKDYLESLQVEDPNVKNMTDGLLPKSCEAYHLACQSLSYALPLHTNVDNTRHEGSSTMAYEQEGLEEENPDAYMPALQGEQAGVAHLVHGWIQQGNEKKGLYVSRDITRTSTSLAAVGSYYHMTKSIAKTIAAMFKAAFPEWYDKYRKAFDAGVWLREDPGPFLGRAVIYKLQGKGHKDRHDLGPSASFGVGNYTGGEMLFPQLGAKFSYDPGHVCIFFSSIIHHKVAKFYPTVQTLSQLQQSIIPGRIGSVFFFPKVSYKILKDKRPNWGYETAFGMNEALVGEE